MSLTSHLRDKGSPVRVWLNARFPQLTTALRSLRGDLPPDLLERTIRPPDGVPPSTIGVALDYRVRFWLGLVPVSHSVAYEGARQLVEAHLNEHDSDNVALWRNAQEIGDGIEVGGWVDLSDAEVRHLAPAAFFAGLDPLIAAVDPVGRTLDDGSETRLDAICCGMALFEEVFRYGGIWERSPLASLPMVGSADDIIGLVPESWTTDMGAVSRRLFREVGDRLSGPAVLNPTFVLSEAIGGSDADLVLDDCLIEIKSTVNPRLDPEWVRQLLGYVFLDADDACEMSRVGLLLTRQAVLVSWSLDELLEAMTGSQRASLAELRADFTRLVESLTNRQ